MKNLIGGIQAKAALAVLATKEGADRLCARARKTVSDNSGQGTLDVAVTVLISIVLGALILGGLYLIVNSTVLPTITQKIKEMFNYR